ncbi:MAG: hypothetical protein KJZ93_29670 [Caldilineaceae bacterium]|nr:hypothetical protein [Caldilineaceae bacterium]
MHSTNYTNAFIEVADDCKSEAGLAPPEKRAKTIARMQYEMIHDHPYQYTSDDIIFAIYAAKNEIEPAELERRRVEFFSRGQPCLRSSPLGKSYGWGIHFDGESKITLYAKESVEYTRLKNDPTLKQVKAMRTARLAASLP